MKMTKTSNTESHLKGERHPFKPWTGEHDNLASPRPSYLDTDKDYAPARFTVKGKIDGEYWYVLPNGKPLMLVPPPNGTIVIQKRELADKEHYLKKVADEGMVGYFAGASVDEGRGK